MTSRWYVVQTNSKSEALAAVQLKNQNFGVLLPLFKKKYFKKSILFTVCNLFPTYIFVHFDVDIDPWRSINGTRGVKKILSMNQERPSPINSQFIEEIISKMDPEGYVEIVDAENVLRKFSKGEMIKIIDGPFKGHSGTYEMSDKKRISILLSCFGNKNRVWLDPNQVVRSTT